MSVSDHMMAMKMINEAHIRKGKVKSFTSYCGGLPSPSAANNPLAYKFRYIFLCFLIKYIIITETRLLSYHLYICFSWNPAGAIRAGRNPAKYKSNGDIIHVDGNDRH